MPLWKGRAAALAALIWLVAATPAQAGAMKFEALTAVSGPTPFVSCPFDAPPPFTDREWQPKDSAVEPHIAIDPKRPQRMAVAWMQDVTASVVVGYTTDGGKTWGRSVPQKLGKCSGADEGTAVDPRLAFGADGLLYLSTMRRLVLRPARSTPDDEVAVSVSEDGGRTWRDPVTVQARDGYNDYPHIAADPGVPGRAYVQFTKATEPVANALGTMFSVTEDGGRTWSPPRQIYSMLPNPGYFNSMIVAPGKNRVTLMIWTYDAANYFPLPLQKTPSEMFALSSADGGRTFAKPVKVGEQTEDENGGDPESGEAFTSGQPYSSPAPDGGIYSVWHDYDGARTRLQIVRQRGDGTWEEPRTVVPWGAPQMLLPMVAVTPEGTLGVMFYDTRSDRPDDGKLLADVWLSVSRDGGRTFGQIHMAGPIDLRLAWSDARSLDGSVARFLGDYTGMAARPHGFAAALPMTAPVSTIGRSQVFVGEAQEATRKPRTATKKKKRKRARRRR